MFKITVGCGCFLPHIHRKFLDWCIMTRKPTPAELADYITEDQYGLPMLSQEPGGMESGQNMGPMFDQGGDAGDNDGQDTETQVSQCAAITCSNNKGGRCGLEAVEINDRGGCEQFEAGADNVEGAEEDEGRYEEEETDVSGNSNTNASNLPQPGGRGTNQDGGRHWKTGKWDSQGGGN